MRPDEIHWRLLRREVNVSELVWESILIDSGVLTLPMLDSLTPTQRERYGLAPKEINNG